VLIGATVLALALTAVYAVIPFTSRWQAREKVIAAEVERLERLRGLVADEAQLSAAVLEHERALDSGERRLLSGGTAGLAASELQSRLQDFADFSAVTVSGLDVTGEPETSEGMPMIPATVSAVGDIYGITDLLHLIEQGPLLLEISDVSLSPNPALRGGLLQMRVALRAAYIDG
jgi:hypothetical protein